MLSNWLVLYNNNITSLKQTAYMQTLSFLHLGSNQIQEIDNNFLASMKQNSTIEWMNLSDNSLEYVPKEFELLPGLKRLWLGGNPLVCNCAMTWIISWLQDTMIVQDYKNMKCEKGQTGTLVYQLNEWKLGCFTLDADLVKSVLVAISTVAGTLLAVVVILLIAHKRQEEIQLWMYLHWDIFPSIPDGDLARIPNVKYDAFLSSRYVHHQS